MQHAIVWVLLKCLPVFSKSPMAQVLAESSKYPSLSILQPLCYLCRLAFHP
jgi:hypothetical protein